ncbi:Phosphotyrosyl phosphatase activator [Panus rudis PR-1116 ss-1]|nr:Phosphotyrosyl phosphatase activator [Panus rudis PR-1116 ss-1]
MSAELPSLRHITIAEVAAMQSLPSRKIRTDEDVELWKTTRGYQDYGLFLRRLNESVVGHFLPYEPPTTTQATKALLSLLDTLDQWIDEIPPLPTPQRFGNLAFRTWGQKLEDNLELLLKSLLPSDFEPAIPHLSPYLTTSFGSFTRMDYGTGHETSFALLLLCLGLIRFFEPEPEQEREIVLIVFVRYLQLCWRLQDVYRLEPAGSHGVWGLDDYSFLGYIFGSAQLRESDIPVSSILRPPLPPSNLYYLSISRIHQVKSGPFHEHSSQLYSIATGVPKWTKVNSGLFKMYEAEVLGKRVVVQHIPLGGLLEWNIPSSENPDTERPVHVTLPSTQAPWFSRTSSLASYPRPSEETSMPHIADSSASTRLPTSIPPPSSSSSPSVSLNPFPPRGMNAYGWMYGSRSIGAGRQGPIVPGQTPLGPAANSSFRPADGLRSGGPVTQTRTTMGPPPGPNSDSTGEEDRH